MLCAVSVSPKKVHGNTSTGLQFVNCGVGGKFTVDPEEYPRANSARAHFQKRMMRLHREEVRFTSQGIKDELGRVVKYEFTRVK